MKFVQFCSTLVTCLISPPRHRALTVGRRRACSSDSPVTVCLSSPRCWARVPIRSRRSAALEAVSSAMPPTVRLGCSHRRGATPGRRPAGVRTRCGHLPAHADARAGPAPQRGHATADRHEAGRPGLAGRSCLQPGLFGRGRRARAVVRRARALQRRERPERPGLPEHRHHAARHRVQHRHAARRRRPRLGRGGGGLPHLRRHREPPAGGEDGARRRTRAWDRPTRRRRRRVRARRLHQGGGLLRRRPGPRTGRSRLPGQRRRSGGRLFGRHDHGGGLGADLPARGDRPHHRPRVDREGSGHPVPRRRLHGRVPPPVPRPAGPARRAVRLPRPGRDLHVGGRAQVRLRVQGGLGDPVPDPRARPQATLRDDATGWAASTPRRPWPGRGRPDPSRPRGRP